MPFVSVNYQARFTDDDLIYPTEYQVKGQTSYPLFTGLNFNPVATSTAEAFYDGIVPANFAADLNTIGNSILKLNLSLIGNFVQVSQSEVALMTTPSFRTWLFSSSDGSSLPLNLYRGKNFGNVVFSDGLASRVGSTINLQILVIPETRQLVEIYDAAFPYYNGFLVVE